MRDETLKEVLHKTKEISRKIVKTAVPILAYGTYLYFMQNYRRRGDLGLFVNFGNSDITSDNLYGCAANAICNSDMDAFYKHVALNNLKKGESDEYYEAVIAIANSSMEQFYRAASIGDV